ncbi:MAG: GNAT family N-acetyltransferase [Patescibacteria group bacterium]
MMKINMKSGKIVEKYKLDGQEVIFRYPKWSDLKDLRVLINSLVAEKAFTSVQERKTLEEERKWLANLFKEVTAKKNVHLIVEYNGKVMGDANIKKISGWGRKRTGLFGIIFRREIRGKGVAERLLKCIILEAEKVLKVKIIKLTAMRPNKRALAFYRKQASKK